MLGVKYGVALKGKSLFAAKLGDFIGGVCLVYYKFGGINGFGKQTENQPLS